MIRIASQKAIDLIKHFEGFRSEPYQDSVGVWTIGYGHTGNDVDQLGCITEQAGTTLLEQDLARFELGVYELVEVELLQNEFDALVCFAYNVGLHNLKTSTLLRLINGGETSVDDEAQQFLQWNHAGGKVLAGLTKRREAESKLFRGEPWN